jgi:hypothetical protein
MAQADHLPSPIHDSFPDASATKPTSRGQPAAHENKKGESDIAAVRTSAPTAEARPGHRRHFIGGSDARIIMGDDEVDGRVQGSEAVFETKFMLPWSFSEEAAVAKYMPQLQHNMWVVTARSAVLSVINGGGKWVGITTHADPLYQHLIITAERKFWRCVESGEPPTLFGVEPPKPRIAAVRIVDMSTSNAWAEFAGTFTRTHPAFLEHERAKAELKGLVPEDAQQAIGHGVRAKRSKSGAITFELLNAEDSHATV